MGAIGLRALRVWMLLPGNICPSAATSIPTVSTLFNVCQRVPTVVNIIAINGCPLPSPPPYTK
eukprot:scaffold70195_cov27-Prasinocladus_malaysianus.AAC.1